MINALRNPDNTKLFGGYTETKIKYHISQQM